MHASSGTSLNAYVAELALLARWTSGYTRNVDTWPKLVFEVQEEMWLDALGVHELDISAELVGIADRLYEEHPELFI